MDAQRNMKNLRLANKENICIKNTKNKGKTYFARKNFKKGETVYYMTGPIVFRPTDYTIPIGFGLFIDPLDYGGMFTNDYGLNANLGIKNRTQLVAIKSIKKGEEIGPAYFMFVPFYVPRSTADELDLSCFEKTPKAIKKRYKNYISDYLFNKKEVEMYRKWQKRR